MSELEKVRREIDAVVETIHSNTDKSIDKLRRLFVQRGRNNV
jgi:hypothetical protein